ncbi:hypothetical protein TL16_g07111 [Triparma laevis f. inornata]|uniref:Uncharacterized protein n=1 Tax=Triparma laevis f. inornata TaxID=1714386 RepID=A0A9W7AW02_9STRA|nr:hypothetical protein TL16_g07111 [Triparma laevis f. inornata]
MLLATLVAAIQKEMKEYSEKAKAKTVVVGGISAKVSELQEANKDAFSIPEWFLYTSRYEVARSEATSWECDNYFRNSSALVALV